MLAHQPKEIPESRVLPVRTMPLCRPSSTVTPSWTDAQPFNAGWKSQTGPDHDPGSTWQHLALGTWQDP